MNIMVVIAVTHVQHISTYVITQQIAPHCVVNIIHTGSLPGVIFIELCVHAGVVPKTTNYLVYHKHPLWFHVSVVHFFSSIAELVI